ncbi:hypothetical protein [uncultured Mediterranean phage]|nr:hypothetical protein [uncultured Mediterranean phage]
MAEEKRTLWSDIKKNIIDVGVKGNITKGDPRSYGKKEIKEDLKSQEYPFYTRPKKKKKADIENYDDFIKMLLATEEKIFPTKKKPTKYTREGAFDAMSLLGFTGPLTQASTLDKLTKQRADKKFQRRRKYVEGYTDIATQLMRGTGNFIQSASEFVLTPIDYVFTTDFQDKFNNIMDKNLSFAADEPETVMGDISKLVGEYTVPLSAATKIKNGAMQWKKLKQLQEYNKTHKGSKIATRMGEGAFILGFADAFVGSGSRPNMERGLPWGALVGKPDKGRINKPIDTKDLTGKDLAKATFINKIRFAREGAMIGGGFPLVGKVAQLATKWGIKPVVKGTVGVTLKGLGGTFNTASAILARTPGVPAVAKATRNWSGAVLEKAVVPMLTANLKMPTMKNKSLIRQLPPFDKWKLISETTPDKGLRRLRKFQDFLSYFSSFGRYNEALGTIDEAAKLTIRSKGKRIFKVLDDINNSAYKLAQGFERRYNANQTSPVGEKYFADQVLAYLKGQLKGGLNALPKELRLQAKDLDEEFNKLRKLYANALPNSRKFAEYKKMLLDDLNKYLRSSFATFSNPLYIVNARDKINATKWIVKNVVRRNKDYKKQSRKDFPNVKTNRAYNLYGRRIMENILHTGRTMGSDPLAAMEKIGLTHIRNDKFKFLKKGELLPTAIKKLLGYRPDLKSQIGNTGMEMVSELVTKRQYDKMAKYLLDNKLGFRTEAEAIPYIIGAKKVFKIPRLGVLPSEILGLHVSPATKRMLEGVGGPLDKLIDIAIWRHALQFKVMTQMGKTVFSPQTQVRNVEASALFPLVNGHIGGRASVIDSMKIVWRDIFPAPGKVNTKKFYDAIEKEVRLGTMDENVIAAEIQAVIKDINKGAINSLDDLFQRFQDTNLVKKTSRVYAGGDNMWKWYGRHWVKSQLGEVFPNAKALTEYMRHMGQYVNEDDLLTGAKKTFDDLLDDASAWEIRNTYPTYSKVPQFIKDIRKIPFFGNFVSFQAEILRTGMNIMNFGLRQASHPNPRIRQMGLNRLMGASLGFYGYGYGLYKAALWLTDSDEEQWDGYKRSFAADWDRASNLLPLSNWDKGKAKAINFSYFSPYDVLQKPIEAALMEAQKQELNPQETEDYVLSQIFGPDGPIMTLLEPFIAEQIGLEKMQDVMPGGYLMGGRDGRTATGSQIYSRSDSLSDKFDKSLAHIWKGIEPGILTSSKKVLRGLTGDVKKGGQEVSLRDELLALMAGIRIIDIDVKSSLSYKAGRFNQLLRAVDDAEKIYSPENYINRGPSVIEAEFEQMQEEAFKIQQEMYNIIQDALLLDLDESDIKKVLKEAQIPAKKIRKLINGEFVPANFSKARFKKKVKQLEEQAAKLTKDDPDMKFYLDEDYAYPKWKLKDIQYKWKDKSLIPEPKEDKPGLIKKGIEKILQNVSPFKGFGEPKERTQIQTPPLDKTPMPKLTKNVQQKDSITNLTSTETALLSPTEKIIAGRT